jgi:hypothetical protein
MSYKLWVMGYGLGLDKSRVRISRHRLRVVSEGYGLWMRVMGG